MMSPQEFEQQMQELTEAIETGIGWLQIAITHIQRAVLANKVNQPVDDIIQTVQRVDAEN